MDRFIGKTSASSISAAQPEANASSSSAAQPAHQLSSIGDVQRWLTTVTEQTSSAKSERIKAAVDVLKVQRPIQADVYSMCPTWSVKRTIKQKGRPLPEIIRDLKEKVIEASNELKVSLAQHPQIATDSAAQPAAPSTVEPSATEAASAASEPASSSRAPPQQRKRDRGPDSELPQSTAKAKPARKQQKRKNTETAVASSAVQPVVAPMKMLRMTDFYELQSGPAPAMEPLIRLPDAPSSRR